MENNTVHTTKDTHDLLKEQALPYLPRNLADVGAQKQILSMIAQVNPAVASYVPEANAAVWQKVFNAGLPIEQAIAQCAYQVNHILGTAAPDAQGLKSCPRETLLQAWIALDYYSYVMKPEYTQHLRTLREQITQELTRQEKGGTVPPEDPRKDTPDSTGKKPDNQGKKPDRRNTTPDGDTVTKWNKKPVLLAAAAVVVILLAVFLFSDTRRTEASIKKIGTVTLDSEALILQAEERYDGLTEAQQEKISNRDILFAARAEYDSLVLEAAIDAIGKVTLESGDAITHAEALYDDLSRDARNLVDNYKTLTAARKEYDRLDKAVKDASDAIDAIGKVTLSSGDKIENARAAYDALKKDDLQKYLSGKVSTLTAAEKEYKQLVSQDLYDTGISHQEKGDYEAAIAAFDTILTDYSDSSVAGSAKKARADSQIAMADAACQKKDYYTAMKTLDAVDSAYRSQENYRKSHEQVTAALAKARPKNGAAIDGKIDWGYCYFQLTAGSQDVCFKFTNTKDSSKYKMVYVQAGKTAKVNLKDGTYSVKWVTGEYWYGKDHLFGDDGKYRSRGTAEFTTTRDGSWIHYWYYDFDLSDPGFSSTTITAKDF